MKRLLAAGTAVLLCFSCAFAREPAEEMSVAATLDFSQIQAGSYLLMEMQTGRVLAGENIHEKMAVASTTKMMTSLIALEQPDLDEYFEVDSKAILVEGSSMGLLPGDQITLRILATGMLLSSGNDAANATAVKIGGSTEDFAQKMNARAEEIGMETPIL